MPPLPPPSSPRTIMLPARPARLAAEADVLVVVGGPAGLGAALGAAAAGAQVVLVERCGFLGGNATAALLMPLMSFHTQRDRSIAFEPTDIVPWDHGAGDPVVAGVVRTLLERLVTPGAALVPSERTGFHCAVRSRGMAARSGKGAREVPAADVQAELVRQGASLR